MDPTSIIYSLFSGHCVQNPLFTSFIVWTAMRVCATSQQVQVWVSCWCVINSVVHTKHPKDNRAAIDEAVSWLEFLGTATVMRVVRKQYIIHTIPIFSFYLEISRAVDVLLSLVYLGTIGTKKNITLNDVIRQTTATFVGIIVFS